ncbi:protein flightless-1 homolog [Anopheles moucheti]|uniref:protein flightless-1 homolog n=1 Tax=Anopheles moucheti TaxID=186751 RepID=UPI0022EFEA8D|nr:protein flightless-1 homolog [Anopheles moucheti]
MVELPRTMHNARSLKFLSVTESNVRHLDLAKFCDLALLETMIWKRNKIRGIVNSATRPCALYGALKYLKLSENKLKTLQLQLFAPFQQITHLDLRNNKIHSITGTHRTLVTLQITDNKLAESALCRWNLPRASILSLQNNVVSNVPPCLQNWKHIHRFSLTSNELSNFSIESVANMDSLGELSLAWNKIEFVQLRSYQFPKNLTELNMSNNRLHQLDLSLVPVPSLRVIVDWNFITTFDVNATSPNVSALEMSNNPIACAWKSPQERNRVQCKQVLFRTRRIPVQ